MKSLPDFFGWFTLSGVVLADLVFLVMAVFTAIMSLILFFHWRKYGMNGPALILVEILYLVVAAAFLATAFFALK